MYLQGDAMEKIIRLGLTEMQQEDKVSIGVCFLKGAGYEMIRNILASCVLR